MRDQTTNKKVIIVQGSTPQYRVKFFELLKNELSLRKIDLELIYGERNENKKNDFVSISWANYKKTKTLKLGPFTAVWHPILRIIRNADLIIVGQHNTQLINYVLLAERIFSRKRKIAFWGHGRNMQTAKNSLANRFKKSYTNYCDWWFAYTAGVKNTLIENGYSEEKITIVHNAIDTKNNINLYDSIQADEINKLRSKYGISDTDVIGIYCGGLYKEKRIDFLIEAADRIHRANPNFKLLILGSGPDRAIVEEATKSRSWLIWTGTVFDREKALHFKISSFFLLPGLVGLAVLDSFSFKCPVITTQYEFHSPEFEYLDNGVDAIVTQNSLEDYVDSVNQLILDNDKLNFLKQNCLEKAKTITIENMVKNFADGINSALQSNSVVKTSDKF